MARQNSRSACLRCMEPRAVAKRCGLPLLRICDHRAKACGSSRRVPKARSDSAQLRGPGALPLRELHTVTRAGGHCFRGSYAFNMAEL